MRVLVLGPNAARLAPTLGIADIVAWEDACDAERVKRVAPDLIVSFGYRFLLGPGVLAAVSGAAVNLHISHLPWNRGADPNFWSWLEHTPKGVSVHWMIATLDRGDLVAQREVDLDRSDTLRVTHERLQSEVVRLFADCWPVLQDGAAPHIPQPDGGSYHRSADKKAHTRALPAGWDTRCAHVEAYGRDQGLWIRG